MECLGHIIMWLGWKRSDVGEMKRYAQWSKPGVYYRKKRPGKLSKQRTRELGWRTRNSLN
jgi:hypothetical protein